MSIKNCRIIFGDIFIFVSGIKKTSLHTVFCIVYKVTHFMTREEIVLLSKVLNKKKYFDNKNAVHPLPYKKSY